MSVPLSLSKFLAKFAHELLEVFYATPLFRMG
jgi:hypothetical protein